jgi:hypothetical protein
MSETNWKAKYHDLRLKFMNAVDTSFRIGFEQGAKEAQMQAQAEAAAQAQAQAQQAAQMGGQPGEEGGEAAPGEEQGGEQPGGQPGGQAPGGSELDQHISTLESMVQKSEFTAEDVASLKKSMESLKAIQQEKQAKAAINSIAKALNRPNKVFSMSPAAKANLSSQAKSAVNAQEKLVSDVMKSWAEEEERAKGGILEKLAAEGILKKD